MTTVTTWAARKATAAHRRGEHNNDERRSDCRLCRRSLNAFVRFGVGLSDEELDRLEEREPRFTFAPAEQWPVDLQWDGLVRCEVHEAGFHGTTEEAAACISGGPDPLTAAKAYADWGLDAEGYVTVPLVNEGAK